MNKKSVLKKQFKEKDVQRLRNLVQGKHGAKTEQTIGYTKEDQFHEEGDIWEEDERKWTIKDGIRQNITKLNNRILHVPHIKLIYDDDVIKKEY